MLLIKRGCGTHLIDFSSIRLQPGSLLFVRPGQVQQWQLQAGIEGNLILVDPAVMNPQSPRLALHQALASQWSDWPSFVALSVPARREIQQQF